VLPFEVLPLDAFVGDALSATGLTAEGPLDAGLVASAEVGLFLALDGTAPVQDFAVFCQEAPAVAGKFPAALADGKA